MPAMPFLKTLVEMKDFATLGSGLHPKSSNEQKENEKMCENYILKKNIKPKYIQVSAL